MPHSETYDGLYQFFEGFLYATVEVVEGGDGWVSTWTVSRKPGGDLGEVSLIGYVSLPVWGEEKENAVRRLDFVYEDVVNFLDSTAGGTSSLGAGTSIVNARKHAKAHLQYWSDMDAVLSKTEHTAAMYSLALDFGVSDPAALIAEIEVVGVRTIHERIAYARRIGLLNSYGRGRVRKAEVEPDVTERIEPPKTGVQVRRGGVWTDFSAA